MVLPLRTLPRTARCSARDGDGSHCTYHGTGLFSSHTGSQTSMCNSTRTEGGSLSAHRVDSILLVPCVALSVGLGLGTCAALAAAVPRIHSPPEPPLTVAATQWRQASTCACDVVDDGAAGDEDRLVGLLVVHQRAHQPFDQVDDPILGQHLSSLLCHGFCEGHWGYPRAPRLGTWVFLHRTHHAPYLSTRDPYKGGGGGGSPWPDPPPPV